MLVTSTRTIIECRYKHILMSTVVMKTVDTSAHSFFASFVLHRAISNHSSSRSHRSPNSEHHRHQIACQHVCCSGNAVQQIFARHIPAIHIQSSSHRHQTLFQACWHVTLSDPQPTALKLTLNCKTRHPTQEKPGPQTWNPTSQTRNSKPEFSERQPRLGPHVPDASKLR